MSQRGSHKHSSYSNLSPYSLDSLPCLSGEHRAWVQHCWRGRQSSYWGGPQHLHHQDHPRGCRCRGRETEVGVYIILQGSKCMNNFAGSLAVFEDSSVVLFDLLKLIWSCLDYLTCYATINYWRKKILIGYNILKR